MGRMGGEYGMVQRNRHEDWGGSGRGKDHGKERRARNAICCRNLAASHYTYFGYYSTVAGQR